ncbi:MAG TPA: NADP-dependent oxidoreductase [Acidimicrobiales bacterium]|nr:NADP-dependent oxidoreductase [Acidimicrobiales bacterium]
MRIITQQAFGGPEVLELGEAPVPVPLPTEVLVRVRAAGVNPVDWKTRSGRGMAAVLGDPPLTVGWDVAGVVEAVGHGVTTLAPGDPVFGMPWFPRAANAYAEYVTAPSRQFARKPPQLTFEEAGGLALAGLTAWQILVDLANVQPGQRVLITAAAGGVGHLATQVAKGRGAVVVGTARTVNHAALRRFGVDEPIDYTTTDVAAAAGQVDLIVDLVGGSRELIPALRPGGLFVNVPSAAPVDLAAEVEQRGARFSSFLVEPDHEGLFALTQLVEDGELAVEVAATLPLAEAAEAHRRGETGRTVGKIVLTV